MKLSEMHSSIDKMQAKFFLRLSSKHLLSQEVISDIHSYCEEIHKSKMDFVSLKLQNEFGERLVTVSKVIETIKLMDNVTGLKNELSTHYKRDQYFKANFNFIQAEKIILGYTRQIASFYYYKPVQNTLARLINDNTIRQNIIKEPKFNVFNEV